MMFPHGGAKRTDLPSHTWENSGGHTHSTDLDTESLNAEGRLMDTATRLVHLRTTTPCVGTR